MRHFSSEQWTDFVRNALKPEDVQRMQAHLETGCQQCTNDLAAWTRISDVAANERAFEPPAAVVKMAKAAVNLHSSPARLPVAELLFDSFGAPALAGVRTTEKRSRQTLYGFDDYRIDLRFEPNFDTNQALLVGQVLKSGSSEESLGQIIVSLLRGDQALGFAKANEFGEFQLECDLGGRLELQLTLPDGAKLRVPMVEPTSSDEKPLHLQVTGGKRVTRRRQATGKSTRK